MPKKIPISNEWIVEKIKQGLTCKEIANIAEVSSDTIRRRIKQNNLKPKLPSDELTTQIQLMRAQGGNQRMGYRYVSFYLLSRIVYLFFSI